MATGIVWKTSKDLNALVWLHFFLNTALGILYTLNSFPESISIDHKCKRRSLFTEQISGSSELRFVFRIKTGWQRWAHELTDFTVSPTVPKIYMQQQKRKSAVQKIFVWPPIWSPTILSSTFEHYDMYKPRKERFESNWKRIEVEINHETWNIDEMK